jgi:hypothetical protein
MTMLEAMATRVAAGRTVEFRPTGNSMTPLIRSRALVRVVPVDPSTVERGDIVLTRVAGTTFVHLVAAVDHANGRVQIGNDHGHVNGWTTHARVYGLCVAVDGVPRPRTAGKTR